METQENNVVAPAPQAPKAVKKAKAPKAAKVEGPVITLTSKKPEYKTGSARELWYAALRRAEGKSPEAFCEAASKKPPTLTKSGAAESPASWLRYFVREGLAKIG